MISIPLTPENYLAAVSFLANNKPAQVKSFIVARNVGTLITDQIQTNFTYNGTDTIEFNVTARHGMAKLASDSMIRSHLVALFAQLPV
jgi:hypothetical protein